MQRNKWLRDIFREDDDEAREDDTTIPPQQTTLALAAEDCDATIDELIMVAGESP